MLTTINPSLLKGEIQAPASKSSMQRACAAALLNKGTTSIYNPGHSNDDKAALSVIQALGAEIVQDADVLRIVSHGVMPGKAAVNCGESGLGIRMFAPIIALRGKPIAVNGEGSLLTTPMDCFDGLCPELGIRVVSNEGRLALEVYGPV